MLKDTWVDKQDGVDIASAADINLVANAVVYLETSLDKVDNTPDSEKYVAWAENADTASYDVAGRSIVDTYATKDELSTAVGDISTTLDGIIALQNSYIGGASA